MSAQGVSAKGDVCLGGVCQTPPVDRITDTCNYVADVNNIEESFTVLSSSRMLFYMKTVTKRNEIRECLHPLPLHPHIQSMRLKIF